MNEKFKTKLTSINSCPEVDESLIVDVKLKNQFPTTIDPCSSVELKYNARYDDLFAPVVGPTLNPDEHQSKMVKKNFLTGNLESAHINDYHFERQRKYFHAYGVANNPSDGALVSDIVSKAMVIIFFFYISDDNFGDNFGDNFASF